MKVGSRVAMVIGSFRAEGQVKAIETEDDGEVCYFIAWDDSENRPSQWYCENSRAFRNIEAV